MLWQLSEVNKYSDTSFVSTQPSDEMFAVCDRNLLRKMSQNIDMVMQTLMTQSLDNNVNFSVYNDNINLI